MGKANSSFKQKVAWLVARPDIWKFWPNPNVERQIIDAMKKDGLVSSKSKSYDIMDFGRLMGEVKATMRKGSK